jgi:hypothetical protein
MRKVDFHAPLNPEDSEKQTLGCRRTNPENCGSNSMANFCAFVRNDELCQSPPRSWRRQYRRLLRELESPGE